MTSASDLNTRTYFQGTYGNAYHDEILLAFANGELIAAAHNHARLPAGLRIFDWHLQITDASNASVTMNIGLKSVSGVNQDAATYFFAAQAMNATGLFRKNNILLPFTLAQEMYVQTVIAGANITESVAATLHIQYRNIGTL
jgi:hypothetical protein